MKNEEGYIYQWVCKFWISPQKLIITLIAVGSANDSFGYEKLYTDKYIDSSVNTIFGFKKPLR